MGYNPTSLANLNAPWQPGVQPAGAGRPVTAQTLTARLRHYSEMSPDELRALNVDKLPMKDALAVTQLLASLDVREDRHYSYDRLDGKPTVVVERTDEERLAAFQDRQTEFLELVQATMALRAVEQARLTEATDQP